jgi:superfamily II DNA helicase RecQ
MKIKTFQIRLNENLQADQEMVNNFLAEVTIKKTSTELVSAKPSYWSLLAFYTDEKPGAKSDKLFFPVDTVLTPEEGNVYLALKQWRQERAELLALPSYLVAGNAELVTISKVKPQSIEELAKIRGFGEQKLAKYGEDIIALVNSVA